MAKGDFWQDVENQIISTAMFFDGTHGGILDWARQKASATEQHKPSISHRVGVS